MKSILFIAYHFPPHGGAGVQRSLKFVKYLPSFGIQPTVLTGVAADHGWSPPDRSLENEIPPEVAVVRTAWPAGTRAQQRATEERRLEQAAQLVADRGLEAIFVSMSPFSDAGFAARLAARCGVPWIADLRDPWALDEFQVYRTRWHRVLARRQMRRALQTASLIVMNTPEAALALRRAFPEFDAQRVASITNGFDADDLMPSAAGHRTDRFTLVHAGFLHAAAGLRQQRQAWQYRLLGRIEPGVEILPRSHFYLLQALARWRAEDPGIERHVRFLLAGELRPTDQELVIRSPAAPLTTVTGYLPHAESVRLVRDAGLLFLPMHKLPPGRRATIVPGKTYEYLASGRTILAPVPQGDARDFLTEARTGLVCEPDDVNAMVAHLRTHFRSWSKGEHPAQVDSACIARFERKELTRQLASHLHALAACRVRIEAVSPREHLAAGERANSTGC